MGISATTKFIISLVFLIIFVYGDFLALSSVVALGANIICNKIPGLAPRQRAICRSRPVAIAVIGEGAKMGITECQYQFRNRRWNCSSSTQHDSFFGFQPKIASREAAFWSAISSSGVVYAITQACSVGNLDSCGCAKTKLENKRTPKGWKWGGCSADIRHGLTLGRKFLDAKEIEETARSLMNRHNNKAGRKAVKDNLVNYCKCHGPTGGCTFKTCWKQLPPFRRIGEYLYEQYESAEQVDPWNGGSRSEQPRSLLLKHPRRKNNRKPRSSDLVYLERSPSYCEYDSETGSLGTVGRICNITSYGLDGCMIMCCGRGYNTHQFTKTWECNCVFHWCCKVDCNNCTGNRVAYTCK